MKRYTDVVKWVERNPLDSEHVDCATAVMLKILDGKCKMNVQEKPVMTHLYHAVKHQPGIKLGAEMHRFIAEAERNLDEDMRNAVYEKRVLAETMISRPVMKAFKAMIRRQGLFDDEAGGVSGNNESVGNDGLEVSKLKSSAESLPA